MFYLVPCPRFLSLGNNKEVKENIYQFIDDYRSHHVKLQDF